MSHRHPPRRGVLILIVICLLVLFSLVAVTFAILAGNYLRSAKAAARLEETGDSRREALDQALYTLLVDMPKGDINYPVGPCALYGHGLLRHLYGNDFASSGENPLGSVTAASSVDSGSPFIDLTVSFSAAPIRGIAEYYDGCLLTVRTGKAAGYSFRIVGYNPTVTAGTYTAASATFRLVVPETDQTDLYKTLSNTPATILVSSDVNNPIKVTVNGRPGNGQGYGYDGKTVGGKSVYNLTQTFPSGSDPWALLPNFGRGYRDTQKIPQGDADVGFDVPDFRDMALAYIYGDFPTTNWPNGVAYPTGSARIIPSFHRPELINYWRAQSGSAALLADRLTYSCLRPLPFKDENPDFTGSNPYLQFAGGVDKTDLTNLQNLAFRLSAAMKSGGNTVPDNNCTWDVDNDGDGVPDSIWVDIGLPVRMGKNGRAFKPLVAFLVRDLDGRLNVNAHGNLLQATDEVTSNATAVYAGNNGSTSSPALFHGSGTGPAGISLQPVMGTEADPLIRIRYANDGTPGGNTATVPANAVNSQEKAQWALRNQGRPFNYPTATPGIFGSPPDGLDRGTHALDPDGNPVYAWQGRTRNGIDENTNNPYLINLFNPTSLDAVFTPSDLELLLNPRDPEVQARFTRTSARLAYGSAVLNAYSSGSLNYSGTAVAQINRNRDALGFSWDTLGLFGKAPPYLRQILSNGATYSGFFANTNRVLGAVGSNQTDFPPTVLDIFAAKMLANGIAPANVSTELAKIVPREMFRGLPFNVNRPWGNGLDEQAAGTAGSGTVDEPTEVTSEKALAFKANFVADTTTYSANYVNDIPTAADPTLPGTVGGTNGDTTSAAGDAGRLLYARYLYCLALLMVDEDITYNSGSGTYAVGSLFLPTDTTPETLTPPQLRELLVRRIAQWAINCAEFRDSDGIMTRFVYDVNPWQGWGKTPANLRTVWGMEYPELLLQESVAFHDRRVRDTSADTGGASDHKRKKADGTAKADDTLDQFAVPQGSLFLKLYCPRPTYIADTAHLELSQPLPPKELYNYVVSGTRTVAKLDLARLSPATPATAVAPTFPSFTYPVWRIAISEAHNVVAGQATKSALALSANSPASTTFQPGDVGAAAGEMSAIAVVGGTSHAVAIDRVIWFANLAPPALPNADRIYYNRFASGTAQLAGGSYAVVGPRGSTRFGADTSLNPSKQRITLSATGVKVYDPTGADVSAAPSGNPDRTVVGIVAAAKDPTAPTSWSPNLGIGGATGVGISVSEPLPSAYYPAPDQVPLTNFAAGEGFGYTTPKDVPFDNPAAAPGGTHPAGDANVTTPLQASASLRATGTTPDYRTAYVQRLANPLAPFDATNNPYVTIDWMPIDLTTFNGFDRKPGTWDNNNPANIGDWDPDDPDTHPANWNAVALASRQRDGNGGGKNILWSFHTNTPQATPADGNNSTDFFTSKLNASPNSPQALGAFSAAAYGDAGAITGTGDYSGSPSQPFPWLTWHNRPFTTPLEMMLVPTSSPGRLSIEFGVSPPLGTRSPYAAAGQPTWGADGTYQHLWNFFQSNETNNVNAGTNAGLNLGRIFDYLEVPSPFVGSEQFFDPNSLGTSGSVGFRAPFNSISRYRVPGKVNLNTIADNRVLAALLGVNSSAGAAWDAFFRSRQGFAGYMDDNFPTRFAGVFRDASGADLAPLANLQQAGAQATILRADPVDTGDFLFRLAPANLTSPSAYNDANRNADFRYGPMIRLANTTTTRSNVFAVWITVGFFEVDTSMNLSHGGAIGREVGSETGEVVRYRGFFLIDRSLPVQFSGGQPGNVDRAVLLRRYMD